MDKLRNNKGFTLVEVLIVLLIVIVLSQSLVIKMNQTFRFEKPFESFQIQSLLTHKRHYISDHFWYNERGHINQGGVLTKGSQKCTIYLGFGRYRCEKG